jgi:hypothetical protein
MICNNFSLFTFFCILPNNQAVQDLQDIPYLTTLCDEEREESKRGSSNMNSQEV